MKYTPQTLGYFFIWGTLYGLFFGTWSTTIMLPLIGTMFGAAWGTSIGMACGFLCGLLVSLVQAYTFHPDVDLVVYSRRLSLVVGVGVGIVAPLMLIATSQGILWGTYSAEGDEFLIPSLVAVIFWSSLCAAYTAHGYPLRLAHIMMGQQDSFSSKWTFAAVMKALMRKSATWTTVFVGGTLGVVYNIGQYLRYRDIGYGWQSSTVLSEGIEGIVGGLLVIAILIALFLIPIVAVIMFLGRVMFSDGALSGPQRLVLTASAAIFTGIVLQNPVTTFGGDLWIQYLPICGAVLAGFYVYQALPLLEAQDKAKHKEKEAALSDAA